MNKRAKIFSLMLIAILLISISLGCISQDENGDDDEENGGKEAILKVLSANQVEKSFSLEELQKITSVERKVSYQNKFGNYNDESTYKAVLIKDILSTSGFDLKPGDTLKISASDGYTQEFNYYNVYPPDHWFKYQGVFGIAYEFNGQAVPDWTEGPMSVMLPDDNKYSQDDCNATSAPGQGYFKNPSGGARFIRNSAKIEIISNNIDEWEVELSATLSEEFSKTDFEILEGYYPSSYTNSTGAVFTGVPLWRILGRIDDSTPRGVAAFNETKSKSGYEVWITAGDDYSKNITSSLISKNDKIILASQLNSAELPEKNRPVWVVGEGLKTSQMVFNVIKIEIKSS
jgi:hypothetical protein